MEVRSVGEGSLVSPEDTAAVTAESGEARATSTFKLKASMASTSRVEVMGSEEWCEDASGLAEGEEAAESAGEEAGEDTAVAEEGRKEEAFRGRAWGWALLPPPLLLEGEEALLLLALLLPPPSSSSKAVEDAMLRAPPPLLLPPPLIPPREGLVEDRRIPEFGLPIPDPPVALASPPPAPGVKDPKAGNPPPPLSSNLPRRGTPPALPPPLLLPPSPLSPVGLRAEAPRADPPPAASEVGDAAATAAAATAAPSSEAARRDSEGKASSPALAGAPAWGCPPPEGAEAGWRGEVPGLDKWGLRTLDPGDRGGGEMPERGGMEADPPLKGDRLPRPGERGLPTEAAMPEGTKRPGDISALPRVSTGPPPTPMEDTSRAICARDATPALLDTQRLKNSSTWALEHSTSAARTGLGYAFPTWMGSPGPLMTEVR